MSEKPDPAAIFAAAWSLHEVCVAGAKSDHGIDLSDSCHGRDEFLRQVMRIGALFELWACDHVEFVQLDDCWPYRLQDDFGAACLEIFHAGSLMHFGVDDCLRIALKLRFPVRADGRLPVPVRVEAANPNQGAKFARFRIQTVRERLDEYREVVAFTGDDDPFDGELGSVFIRVFGVCANDTAEPIGDYPSYADAVRLWSDMMPEVVFPSVPVAFCGELSI